LPGKEKEAKTEVKLRAEQAGQKLDNAVRLCESRTNLKGLPAYHWYSSTKERHR
jgi:hypothetical protein